MSDEWQGWSREFPSREAVEAHVAASPPPPYASAWAKGAPWLRVSGCGDIVVIYLAVRDGEVRARFGGGAAWHALEFGRVGRWRPITALGEATDERDAAQTAIVEALEGHAAQLRGARATITALLHAAEAESADRAERWSKSLADVERLTVERDAAFTRGVEAMREAAAKVAAECASERGHAQATMFAASRPDDAFVVGIKGGEASRIEALIRAIKVAP